MIANAATTVIAVRFGCSELLSSWWHGAMRVAPNASVPSALGCHANLSTAVAKVGVWIEAAWPL